MLGTGLGVNSFNYVDEGGNPNLQYIRHTESISFASSTNNVIEDTGVAGNLTITAGQTAPGSSNSDWLKVVYDTNQTAGFANGIRILDPFNAAYDYNPDDYVALAVDIFLETGFWGRRRRHSPVRCAMQVDFKSWVFTTSGNDQLTTNTEHVDHGAFDNNNNRYKQIDGSNPGELWRLMFNVSSDLPKSGDTFYIRNLRIIAASQDLETDISEDLFT